MMGCLLATVSNASAQTNVTNKYIDNPNFEARFAGWTNNGMTYQTNKGFRRQDGMVFMEKWVNKGSKVGTVSMSQKLEGLAAGDYTLVVSAQNIQQDDVDTKQTGAFVYADNQQAEVSDSTDYSINFTVVTGSAEIGFMTKACTGNWVSIDNFRLYYNGFDKTTANARLQEIIAEAESVVGDGVTGPALQSAIDEAKALLTADGDYIQVAKALERATLNYRISNGTGTVPKVTTWDFVPTGVTVALGRMTVTGSAKERGFCWSTEPNPTVLDNRSTRYFTNNGNIYCMEHLKPATVYYVRPYAITSNWQVGYGDVVKIATLPESNMTVWYDNEGDEQTDFRIASAVNEVYWLYHNLTNVRGFNLSVHYVPGSGAGGGTADCSYGGYMRVSQNQPYQQTGTILHETNHGVGVGTTGEWYNSSNLRAETSRGLWLGPIANKMVQFLENNASATLTGDGTHMWPYGINGAHEDTYNPENTLLYFANSMTTHALHFDGLICSSSVGFATPASPFQQDATTEYFIKCEDEESVGYLTVSSSNLKVSKLDETDIDDFAWYITYDPKTCYYTFQNVGTGRYITLTTSSTGTTSIKAAKKTTIGATEKFHLLPARQTTTMGNYSGCGYWITAEKGAYALQLATNATSTSTTGLNFANSATNQRWLFLTEDELGDYEQAAVDLIMTKLDALLKDVETMLATPHVTNDEGDAATADDELTAVTSAITQAKAQYTKTDEVATAISDIEAAVVKFLGQVKVSDVGRPFNLTFLISNPGLDENTDGWNTAATNSYGCCEMFEKTFDFNQTTALKMPAGTYKLCAQAFQRPGSAADTYTEYVTNATDNASAQIYLKTTTQKVKNIWADAQNRSLGGATSNIGSKYAPNNMEAASKWFAKGWYENEVMATTTAAATMKLGIKATKSATAYWTCFDNFRLYFYGKHSQEVITGISTIEDATANAGQAVYDLSGRRVSKPSRGLYIRNGKKFIIR